MWRPWAADKLPVASIMLADFPRYVSVAMIQTLMIFLEVLGFPVTHSQQHNTFIITKDFFSKLLSGFSMY